MKSSSRVIAVLVGLLCFTSQAWSQVDQRNVSTAGLQAPAPLLRTVLFGKVPWVCPEAYWGANCGGGGTFGDLHNSALIAVLGSRPPPSLPVESSQTVASLIAKLQKRSTEVPALAAVLQNADEMSELTRQLTERLQAAGLVDGEGRFSRGAFDAPNAPLKLVTYLETSGRISRSLGSTLHQLLSKETTVAEFVNALDGGRWSGSDIPAASILSNVALASAKYWGNGADIRKLTIAGPGPEPANLPTGAWDAIGALLTWESGPGSIVGGYLMSCAAAGSFL
jgi:hypothetical protein